MSDKTQILCKACVRVYCHVHARFFAPTAQANCPDIAEEGFWKDGEAERLKLDIELVTGVEMEALIKRLYDSPADVIARARDALGGSLKAD